MDDSSFDRLARTLSRNSSRRGALSLVASLMLSGVLRHDSAVAKKRKKKGKKKRTLKRVTVCLNGQSTKVTKDTAFTLLKLGATYGPCPPPPPPRCPDPPCEVGQPCANRNECTTALCVANTCQPCSTPEQCGTDGSGACLCSIGVCLKDDRMSVNGCSDSTCPPPKLCFEGGGSAGCYKLCGAA